MESLRKLLEQLKTRIDGSIANRTVDQSEISTIKYNINQVDTVINLVETYMPDLVDAELIREIKVKSDTSGVIDYDYDYISF